MGYAGHMTAHSQANQAIAELEARLVTAPAHERVALLHALSQEYLYSNLDRALGLAEEAHGLAQAQGDALDLAESIFAVGRAQLALANYRAALAYLETALSRFCALGDTSGEQRSLVRIADVYLDLGRCTEALERYLHGLRLAQELGDRREEAACLNNLGMVYEELADYGQATASFLASLQLGDERNRGAALANLGEVCRKTGRDEEALAYHSQALTVAQRIASPYLEAAAMTCLGHDLYSLGRFKEALDHFRDAQAKLKMMNDRRYELDALRGLGLTHNKLREYGRAIGYHREAAVLAQGLGHPQGEAAALINLGEAHLAAGDSIRALRAAGEALVIAEGFDLKRPLYEAHELLSHIHRQNAGYEAALNHFERFHQVREEVRSHETEQRTRALLAQFEVEKAQQETEIYQLKNEELARLNQTLQETDRQKTELLGQVEQQAEVLSQLVREDALTGLYNRRYLDERLDREVSRARRFGHELSVAICDLDHFKEVNDRFSHAVGDRVLKVVAALFSAHTREVDTVARYGGEEFVLVLPETSLSGALAVCEKVRSAIEGYPWHTLQPGLAVTVSVGVAGGHVKTGTNEFLLQADEQLYEAKRRGRNQVRS